MQFGRARSELVNSVQNSALPPLTPGTNRKVNEVLKASFASWEKEVQNCNITKGKKKPFLDNIILKNSRLH